MPNPTLAALCLLLVLPGCAGSFACKGLPQFPSCKSATEAYRATDRTPPKSVLPESVETESPEALVESPGSHRPTANGLERSQAKTLRIWMAPYEDEAGDWVGARYIVAEIEPRRWRMSGATQPIPRRMAPIQMAALHPSTPEGRSSSPAGFPLFKARTPPEPRMRIEDVDYAEP
jgi:conjugal transfer pilus assembly protein TraV